MRIRRQRSLCRRNCAERMWRLYGRRKVPHPSITIRAVRRAAYLDRTEVQWFNEKER